VRGGLLFAALLVVLAVSSGATTPVNRRGLAAGLAGAIVLVVPVVVVHGAPLTLQRTFAGYPAWAAATAVVATAEEAFLRGALFDALRRYGTASAVVVGAVAFAALHVPLYGWHVVPLDLAVGVFLGALRVATGGWAAPAVAHTGADLVGWWLA
jgi:membrane protease YdiL (CAAX protease family)